MGGMDYGIQMRNDKGIKGRSARDEGMRKEVRAVKGWMEEYNDGSMLAGGGKTGGNQGSRDSELGRCLCVSSN